MLKNLFKYDFKAIGRIMLPIYAGTLIVGIVSGLLGRYLGYSSEHLFSVVVTAVYVMLFVATIIMSFVLSITRFRDNLLGKEGYITNTLPICASKHIWSKMLSATLWQIITEIFAVVSLSVTLLIAYGNPIFPPFRDLFVALKIFIQRLSLSDVKLIVEVTLQLLGYGICAIIAQMSGNLMFYAALTIGHTANDKRVLKSFAAYIGLYLISQCINIFALNVLMLISTAVGLDFMMYANEWFSGFWYIFIPFLIYTLFYFVGYFIITKKMLEKKLNLQ